MGAIGLRSGKRKQDPPQRIVLATALLADDEGTSVVEFALIAPVLVLLLLGTVDIGTAIYDRFALNAAVSAAEQYAILSASAVSSSSEAQLAQSLGTIVAGADSIDAVINVNDGSTYTVTGGVPTAGGSASSANSYYCPVPASGGGVTWGSSQAQGTSCSGGGIAGKFVTIAASKQFTSIFGANSLIPSQTFTTTTVVQAQ